MTALPLPLRWRRVRQGVAALLLDVAIAEYCALGILYLLRHDDYNRPLPVEPWSLFLVLLAGLEVGLLCHALLEGVGPAVGRVRLARAGGEDLPGSGIGPRLLRFAGLHLTVATGGLAALWGLLDAQGRGVADLVSGTQLRAEVELGPEREVLPWYRQSVWWSALALVALTYLVGWRISEVNLKHLATGAADAAPLARGLLTPNWKILGECTWAMVETVYLALMATTFAVPIAVVVSFLAARNIMPRTVLGTAVYALVRAVFTITRSIEPIVWAIVFCVWVGLGPFAGMMALLVHSVAALGKLYSEQVEAIDPGPVEAIRATGAGPIHTVAYAVWPQVVPPFVAFTLYRWDINVRMATIVGLVGGGGIGAILFQNQQMMRWQEVGLIMWIITLVVWLMDVASARIRERIG